MILTITKKSNKREFQLVSYCAKVVLEFHGSSFSLDHLKVDKDKIAGTDGHRLHIADNVINLQPGFYKVVKCNKSEVQLDKWEGKGNPTFPDLDDFIKNACPGDNAQVIALVVPEKEGIDHASNYTKLIRVMDDSESLQYNFVADACPEWLPMTAKVCKEKGHPALLEGERLTAYIMPFRI